MPIRVLIVDDHEIVRIGPCSVLEQGGAGLVVYMAVPIREGGQTVGGLRVGHLLDHQFIARFKQKYGVEVTVYDGALVYTNPRFDEIFGYEKRELNGEHVSILYAPGLKKADVIGQPFWDTYWWSYSPEVQDQLKDALRRAAQGEAVRYDVPVRVAADRPRPWHSGQYLR